MTAGAGAGLRVLRQSSFTALPWKNGGGITHEAIREPAGGDGFRWRVSIAHIDASGPFSHFPEHRRTMVLLRGAGIELRFAEGGGAALRQVGELIEFDGALTAHCELLQGPCVDLNLMVSKSERADARVAHCFEPEPLRAAGDETLLVSPIDGAVTLALDSGESVTLKPWDLAVLSQGSARLESSTSTVGGCAAEKPAAVFLATLKFVP